MALLARQISGGTGAFYLPSGALKMAPGGVFVVRRGNYTPEGESGAEGQGRGKFGRAGD